MAALMSAVTLCAVGVALLMEYDAAFEVQRERLVEIVRSRAMTIEAVAEYDLLVERRDRPGADAKANAFRATLSQLRAAHDSFTGFGETGEFTLARRNGDQIEFLLRQRHLDLDSPPPVPLSAAIAEPMRRALFGTTGAGIARDYRGEKVLAAYQPLGIHGLGLVAKIDLDEMRRPFLLAGAAAMGIALVLILFASWLFLHIGKPIIASLETQASRLRKENTARRAAQERLELLNRALDAIRNVNQTIVRETDPDVLLRQASGALLQTMGLTGVWIAFGVPRATSFASAGWSPAAVAPLEDRLGAGAWPGCCARLMTGAGNRAFVDSPTAGCPDCPMAPLHEGSRRVVFSLRRGQRVVGMMCVSTPIDTQMSDEELDMLSEVAGDLAFAYEHIEKDRSRAAAISEKTALVRAARAVLETTGFQDASRRIFEVAKEQTGATAGYVALRKGEDENGVLFLDSGGTECTVDPSLPMPIRGLRADAYRQVRTVFDNDFQAAEHAALLPAGHAPLRNVMFAPIVLEGVVRGIFGLANKAGDFDEDDARRAQALGEIAALALEKELNLAALAEREQLLERITDNMSDMVCLTDGDGRITYASPSHRQLGYTTEALVGQLVHEHAHPDDRPRMLAALDAMGRHGESRTTEFRYRRTDGSWCWLESVGRVLFDDSGTRTGLLFSTRDVTARKEIEVALRASEAQHKLAQRTAHIGHWRLGAVDAVPEWSDEVFRIFGLAPGEAPPSFVDHGTIIHPEDWDTLRRAIHEGFETGTPFDLEFRILKPGGVVGWMRAIGTPESDARGRTVRMFGTAQDVTMQKQREAEIAALEQQLQRAGRLEAVGKLAGGIAHDFNNLLTVITNYTRMARDAAPEGDPAAEDLTQVLDASARATGLIRQLLAFSRRQVLAPSVLNLNGVIDQMQKLLGRIIGEDIDLQLALREDLWNVMADQAQVEQVLVNLVVNARDAMPEGGHLSIETENVDLDEHYARSHPAASPGPHVLVAVSDSGCGMPAEVREHIFEPFFTTKKTGHGTGLGLATVYGIVKQSGGNIWVYSEPGQGSTFKLYFPRTEQQTEACREQVEPGFSSGEETILLVEDEEMVKDLTQRLLSRAGYRVLGTGKPAEALRLFEDHAGEVDLLLTDVVMPGMSGRELADALLERNPELRILFMSGYTDNAIVHHGILDGDTAFLAKPFDRASLLRAVRRTLGAGSSEVTGEVRATGGTGEESSAALEAASLPPAVRAALADHARIGDAGELRACIRTRVEPELPATAAHLARLVDAYDYARILEFLDAAGPAVGDRGR